MYIQYNPYNYIVITHDYYAIVLATSLVKCDQCVIDNKCFFLIVY